MRIVNFQRKNMKYLESYKVNFPSSVNAIYFNLFLLQRIYMLAFKNDLCHLFCDVREKKSGCVEDNFKNLFLNAMCDFTSIIP